MALRQRSFTWDSVSGSHLFNCSIWRSRSDIFYGTNSEMRRELRRRRDIAFELTKDFAIQHSSASRVEVEFSVASSTLQSTG